MIVTTPPPTNTPWIIAAAAIVALAIVLIACYALPLFFRARQTAKWRKRAPDLIALTYDDGPDDTTTPAVLDLLKELNICATFYLVGFRAQRYPTVAERIYNSHHELAAQSHSHLHAWIHGPFFELKDAQRSYASMKGFLPCTAAYRPPFGKITLPTFIYMRVSGRPIDWWTGAANDTFDDLPDPKICASELLATGGPVILMHSHHEEPDRRIFVLDLTRELVRQGREQGRHFVTMSQLREAVG